MSKLYDDQVRTRLESLGLPPAQGLVLRVLLKEDGLSQHDLTMRMWIAAPTVTGILQRMEGAKLVERRSDAIDERVVRVYLSERGRKAAQAVRHEMDAVEDALNAGLSPQQRGQAHQVLRLLRRNLGGGGPAVEPSIAQLVASYRADGNGNRRMCEVHADHASGYPFANRSYSR